MVLPFTGRENWEGSITLGRLDQESSLVITERCLLYKEAIR